MKARTIELQGSLAPGRDLGLLDSCIQLGLAIGQLRRFVTVDISGTDIVDRLGLSPLARHRRASTLVDVDIAFDRAVLL